MNSERKKMGFEKFISGYTSNFLKFTLLNLIFAVPLCIASAICFAVCRFLLPQLTMVILPFAFVLVSPFFAGLVVAGKAIYFGELEGSVFSKFMKGVKENFKAYLLHGLLAYIAFEGCYHGIVIYLALAKTSFIFYGMLFFSILIALFLLFLFYGVFIMSAFFDLRLKDVYKNSALMTFGELKKNFFATLGIVGFMLVLTLPLMFVFYLSYVWGGYVTAIITMVYLGVILIFIVPAALTSIVTSTLYPELKAVITGEVQAKAREIDLAEAKEKEIIEEETADFEDYSDFDISSLEKSEGDYVFYGGKMIKKSVIISRLREVEEKENE